MTPNIIVTELQVSCKSVILYQNTDPKIRLLRNYFKTRSREKLQLSFFLRLVVTTFTPLVNNNWELVLWSMAEKLDFLDLNLQAIHKILNVKKANKKHQLQGGQNEIGHHQ